MTPPPGSRNPAHSVHDRLLKLAHGLKTDFNQVLERFVAERFLYRLSVSGEVDRFTLKGAAMFLVWSGKALRRTRDVDLLGSGEQDAGTLRRTMEAVCAVPCPEDGLSLDLESLRIGDIRKEEKYVGLRAKIIVRLGSARVPFQVDVGFGDVISPARVQASYPTLLGHPEPRLWVYPRETSIAEKFEAMVKLGVANSRMKDFWDVAVLAGLFDFDGETLKGAIGDTLRRRDVVLTIEPPLALTPGFYLDPVRAKLWTAFRRRLGTDAGGPSRLDEAGSTVVGFLEPIHRSLVAGSAFPQAWPAGGPWQPRATGV
mgnify:CR=1 FL=1